MITHIYLKIIKYFELYETVYFERVVKDNFNSYLERWKKNKLIFVITRVIDCIPIFPLHVDKLKAL